MYDADGLMIKPKRYLNNNSLDVIAVLHSEEGENDEGQTKEHGAEEIS